MKIRARKSQSRLTIKIYLRLRSFDPEGAIGYFDHANIELRGRCQSRIHDFAEFPLRIGCQLNG